MNIFGLCWIASMLGSSSDKKTELTEQDIKAIKDFFRALWFSILMLSVCFSLFGVFVHF